MTRFSSVQGLVGVNSKCGVQSKRKCESHESCVCIVGFSACGCQKKSIMYETECRHVAIQRSRTRTIYSIHIHERNTFLLWICAPVGSRFTNEKQEEKKTGSWRTYLILLPRIQILFMTSLIQTSWHKMAPLTVVYVDFLTNRTSNQWKTGVCPFVNLKN